MLTVLSGFSGVAGLCELGIQRAGLSNKIKVTQFIEIEPYCQRVLAKHFPNVLIHGDIKTFSAAKNSFDILAMGFPCVQISSAGKRTGLAGEDSGLWFEMFRLIQEVQPKAVLIENVANLINNGLHEITESLSSIGYDSRWQILSSAQHGRKPHIRKRCFIIATPHAEVVRRYSSWDKVAQKWSDLALKRSLAPVATGLLWKTEPTICGAPSRFSRRLYGALDNEVIPFRKERLQALGNAVDSDCASIVWTQLYKFCFEELL